MKITIALLLAVCMGLGMQVFKQDAAARQQREQIQQLQTQLETASKNVALDLQEKCARQAREEFKLYGWDKRQMAGLSNHYNIKLNKCFMLIGDTDATTPGSVVTSQTLSDAFEGKEYGSYIWSTQKGKKYWEIPPLLCKVTLPSQEQKTCHSSEEFDELVKQLME